MTWRRVGVRAAALVLCVPLVATAAVAQGWWPWGNQDNAPPPRPRESINRPPPSPIPNAAPPATGQGPIAARPGGSNICLQLEQRLVAETQRSTASNPRESMSRIESEMRQIDRQLNQAQATLDRGDCYEYFLFAKSLRNTPQCRNASVSAESLRRRLSDLESARAQLSGSGGEARVSDDIIRELARNGCGQQYVQEARRLDNRSPFWSSGEEDPNYRGGGNQFGSLPFATYRTVCVRLCDGFFFPVSFSTLPNHFQKDEQVCQSQCAAPAELFYHQNPGADMSQAISAKSQQSYAALKTAFRYKKEFVHGCSCREAEFNPGAGERRADVPTAAIPQPAAAQPKMSPVR